MNAPATQQAQVTIKDLIVRNQNEIAKALPKAFDPVRFTRIAMTTLHKNPTLQKAHPMQFITAIMQCAELGLEPDTGLGSVYLVPFWNSKNSKYDVQVIIGYKGLIDLARRSGEVKNISARVVYEKEKFKLEYGLKTILKHTPLSPDKRGTNKVGAYAIAILKDGTEVFEFLWTDEINKIREQAKSYYYYDKDTKEKKVNENSIWFQYEDDMYKKTAIRRLAKYLPLSPEFQKAATIDEAQEAGEDITAFTEVSFDDTPDYAFPPKLLADVDALCDITGVNDAQKSMKLASFKGDEVKLREWIKEMTVTMNKKIEDDRNEKAKKEGKKQQTDKVDLPPEEKTTKGLL